MSNRSNIIRSSRGRVAFVSLLLSAFYLNLPAVASAQQTVKRDGKEYSVNPQIMADRIMKDVAEIRGLKFKNSISVEYQSIKDFDSYMEEELKEQMPELRQQSIGKVVKKLGLYRGPEIKDMFGTMKKVMESQAAAYYDPKTKAFYVLMGDADELMLGTIFAHELYHGLQDQYFDLDKFMVSKAKTLNDDELMARQAVVEGEATYIMTLWAMKKATGMPPDRELLRPAVEMQAHMDIAMMMDSLKSNPVAREMMKGMEGSIEAMNDIPPFLIETLMGAYTKGMKFVYDVQAQGWDKVAELFKNPPVSTEQILYPQKWLDGEKPFRFEWPAFEDERALKDWKLLDANTIGELQWRVIFSEFGMKTAGVEAAAGWDGDRYAVLQKGEDLLLLLTTSWDTEADAKEFAKAYKDLLEIKYANERTPTRIEINAKDVYIVEGGDAMSTSDLLKFVKGAKREK